MTLPGAQAMSADYVELEARLRRVCWPKNLFDQAADAIAELCRQLEQERKWKDDRGKAVFAMNRRVDSLEAHLAEARTEVEHLTTVRDAHIRVVEDMKRDRDRYKALAEAAEAIFKTFSRDEEQGYRSRDRQYAIELLKPHFPAPTLDTGGSDG